MAKLILILGTLFGLTAVMAGAAADHKVRWMIEKDVLGTAAPEDEFPETNPQITKRLDQYQTGVRYQMFHALALVGLGLLAAFSSRGQTVAVFAAISFAFGVLLFSGGLYLLSAFGMTQIVLVVPIGGTLMVVGWILFLVTAALFEPLIDQEDLK